MYMFVQYKQLHMVCVAFSTAPCLHPGLFGWVGTRISGLSRCRDTLVILHDSTSARVLPGMLQPLQEGLGMDKYNAPLGHDNQCVL